MSGLDVRMGRGGTGTAGVAGAASGDERAEADFAGGDEGSGEAGGSARRRIRTRYTRRCGGGR